MNIKSLLLGSAAALAAVSGAQAADAIVAAAPEPAEYVRVCDAFGTGYFYIPGTETCLKVGGYVRFQTTYDGSDSARDTKKWNAQTRGLLVFDAKNDSELGTIGSEVGIRGWGEGDYSGSGVEIDTAFITVAGFQVGYFYNYWDATPGAFDPGETDQFGSNRVNAIAYNYKSDLFAAGVAVEELTAIQSDRSDASAMVSNSYNSNNYGVGLDGRLAGTYGPVSAELLGAYDFERDEGAVRLILSADLGPGNLAIGGVYSSGESAYFSTGKWSVGAAYSAKITDKLTLTPGIQYWTKTETANDGSYFGQDVLKAGLTVDYKLTSNLAAKVSAQYQTHNFDVAAPKDDVWTGYVRLQRDF